MPWLNFVQDDFSEEDGIAAVHEAFKLGINFFDTSPLYGKTKSEQVRCNVNDEIHSTFQYSFQLGIQIIGKSIDKK